jgi:hypothetical protein
VSRLYLHGIIEGGSEALLPIPGVDGAFPVRIVAWDGLACVTSDYDGSDLQAMPREEVVRRLLAHQRIVERVMQQHPVLPVQFGTLLHDALELGDLLRQGRSIFRRALASVQGKIEIEVAATWDTRRVLQEISQEKEIVRAREELARRGQPTLEERVLLGQQVKAAMDRRRDSYRERMIAFLTPLALDVVPNAMLSEELVMNLAFLIEQAREQEFEEHVRLLDELFLKEITFRVIGPLPPYSFSTVEVTRLTREQVEEARQTLHLDGVTTEAEVRKGYRRLMAQEQRNLRPGDSPRHAEFARLRRASQLLLRHCRAQSGTQADGRNLAPSRDGGDLFSVTIQRVAGDDMEPARFGAAPGMAVA